ncbi:uncharacterized protein LOC143635056 [Bidens hawaiensis]|uniref:uncharacterized protein LOC143635056 n=1 Tax=Bidens hawaiensis TaxID=980011 RepID=UPI00404AD24E
MTDGKTNPGSQNEAAPDVNSPLYIHPSDYPKQMHVNETLIVSNYIDWSQEMLNFLFAKNKVTFIDGSIKKPEKVSSTYMSWMRCDAMVKGWLMTAMEKDIRDSIKYASTASDIWSDLLERFGKENAPRAYELKQALTTTSQNGISVTAYFTKLRGIWDEISSVTTTQQCTFDGCKCDLGKRLSDAKDKERLYEFLMGLDSNFSVLKTQILAMKPIPSLNSAFHLVVGDEKQRAISSEKKPMPEAAVFKAFVPGRRDNHSNREAWQAYTKG